MDHRYQTKDLYEAATLLTKKQQLISLERESGVCWFVFKNEKSCKEISNQFWFGKCLVDAKTFSDSIGKLKNRIFAGMTRE